MMDARAADISRRLARELGDEYCVHLRPLQHSRDVQLTVRYHGLMASALVEDPDALDDLAFLIARQLNTRTLEMVWRRRARKR